MRERRKVRAGEEYSGNVRDTDLIRGARDQGGELELLRDTGIDHLSAEGSVGD